MHRPSAILFSLISAHSLFMFNFSHGKVLHIYMRRVDSLEKTLMLGGIEGRRRRGRWTGRPGVLRFMGSQRIGPN